MGWNSDVYWKKTPINGHFQQPAALKDRSRLSALALRRILHWIGCWQKAPAAHVPQGRSLAAAVAATREPWRPVSRRKWIWGYYRGYSRDSCGYSRDLYVELWWFFMYLLYFVVFCCTLLYSVVFCCIFIGESRENYWKLQQQTSGFKRIERMDGT